MAYDRSSSEVNLDLDLGRDPSARDESHRVDDATFRLAVCGDFSAGSAAGSPPGASGVTLGSARAWRVDRDDFDDVLARVSPSLHLDLGSGVVADVQIRELDDFHPDRLLERVPQFARLREVRERLVDPATFRRTAAELSVPRAPTKARPAAPLAGSLLDSIVGMETPQAAAGGGADEALYDFIQRAMAPHLVDRPDPRQGEMIAQADASIASVMRLVLHHPQFQALESLWRGMYRLVREVDTSERLQVHLVDVGRDAVLTDLTTAANARQTQLYDRLATLAPGEHGGWGVLVAHYSFGGSTDDIAMLDRLAEVGAALNAPWLAEAHPDLALGSLGDEAAAAWAHLRSGPAAGHLGLALPRVLLRLPYGKETDACERFNFEELENADSHNSYLWGNPALFCATLLAQGFSERGSGLAVGASSAIGGLPLHLTRRDGEVAAKPCAEVVMREEDAIALLEAGFIPMISYRDQDVVRVGRMQSVADPVTRLSGRLAR